MIFEMLNLVLNTFLEKYKELILMASKKLGDLIKEARVGADLTQEQLAKKIAGGGNWT